MVIAVGLPEAVVLNVEGEQLDGVIPGLDFLRDGAAGNVRKMTDPVVVVGGGSVAVDTTMTALRMGAQNVTMVCLESPDEIPASKSELKDALEEGVRIMHRWGIAEITGNGSVDGVVLKRCSRVFDNQGRFNPEYDETTTESIPAATVLIAIGQRADDLLRDRNGRRIHAKFIKAEAKKNRHRQRLTGHFTAQTNPFPLRVSSIDHKLHHT